MHRVKGRVSDAMEILREAMKNDPTYARAWHDDIAVMMQDAGYGYWASNDGAARFMKQTFGVDTHDDSTTPATTEQKKKIVALIEENYRVTCTFDDNWPVPFTKAEADKKITELRNKKW